MEGGGGARDGAADGAVSLDAFFASLEKELRRHLRAFVAQWAAAGGGAVEEIASHDVRLMVHNLGRRWDDHGAGQAGKTRDLRLEGSPIIAANFYTIHTVLNRYHHKSTTHWEVFEQGVDCAVRLLRALHTYAGVDTRQSVSGLLDRWQAVEKIGHSAYDHSVKIAVEDVTDERSRASGSCGPRLLLRNLPAEANVRAVIWALQAQDVEVAESQVHLAGAAGGPEAEGGGDGAGVAPLESFVELNSADEQRDLLELGTITIKRTTVEFVKPEETREVVLYLHKRLSAEVIAGAWENEFGQVLAEGAVEYADAAGHVTVVRLTPEQFAEVEGKTIMLLRAEVPLLPWRPAHTVKLQLPSADMSADCVRSIVARNLDGPEAEEAAIEALVLLDTRSCAFVHLAGPAAKAQLLQKKHLDASDRQSPTVPPASPTTAPPSTTTTSASASAKHQDHAVPTQVMAVAVPTTSPAAGVDSELKTVVDANSESTPDRAPVGKKSGPPPTTGEWRVLALSPLPGATEAGAQVTVEQVAELVRAQLGIEPKFISVLRYKTYVRYNPSPSDPVIAVGQTVTHNGALVTVETIAGDLPCWRIGIRTGALPGKPQNAHVAVPAFLQFLANSAPLVGRSCITPIDEATVEIGTEALFKQLLALQSQTLNGVALTFFDARLDRTEQLDDVALVYYLTMKKKGKPVLTGIEKVHSVTTKAFWVYASASASASATSSTTATPTPGAARSKVALVRIVGQSPESVDAAWKRLCAHLATVVRRRAQFGFSREEALFRACFKRKLKSLFWRYASTAMHVDEPEADGGGAQSVVVHIVGPNAQEVARLAQEPNHIRTRLVGECSQPVLIAQLDLAALEKEFDVAVAADWNAKQLKVVGYRDSVRACLARVHALCAKANAGAESAAPATAAGGPQATTTTAVTPMAPAPAAAVPQAQREFTKTIEFAPIEAAAVQRLNLSVVRSKFGVFTKVNLAKRTITFTGPVAAALETASSFVRWFIVNGTRMPKKAAAATHSGGNTKPFVFGADTPTSHGQ